MGPSAWLGEVEENHQPLKIMVPFQLQGTYKVKSIVEEGEYTIEDTVAVLTDAEGNDIPVNMIQKWPVKKAMTNYKEKPRPYKLLETGVRVIDTMNPIVEGGTDLFRDRLVRVRQCFSMPSPNRRKLTS